MVGVVGSSMAMEALKLITGVGRPLIGRLGYYSSMDGTWEYIPLVGDPAVVEMVRAKEVVAGSVSSETLDVPRVASVPSGVALVDVREPHEFAAYAIPGAVNVPLSTIRSGAVPDAVAAGEEVLVYCAAGVRSAQAVAILQEAGYGGMTSLDGGIEGWLDG